MRPHSRGTMRPRFASTLSLLEKRAQGKPGARCTRGLVCNVRKESAHEHTGPAEAIRLSLRDGFTVYFELSPVTGLLPPSSLRSLLLAKLSASTGAPGPHDFAVRDQLTLVFRKLPASTASHRAFVTFAQRPSHRVRRAES